VDGSLVVDGYIEGQIQALGSVSIGKKGRIEGIIQAQQIVVAGMLKGEAYSPLMEVSESGDFHGKAEVDDLIIAKGGRFSGVTERAQQSDIKTLDNKSSSYKDASVIIEQSDND
jgi:cytoskeletal protein CcmA (bactofilin family)